MNTGTEESTGRAEGAPAVEGALPVQPTHPLRLAPLACSLPSRDGVVAPSLLRSVQGRGMRALEGSGDGEGKREAGVGKEAGRAWLV